MKQRNKHTAWILCMAILVCSCRTSRQTQPVVPTEGHTPEERIGLIASQATSYRTLSSGLRFGVKPGVNREITVDAQLRIVRDEMIQLSLRIPILGTEAARINISPNRILIIDRINKVYFVETMDNLKERFPFEFDYYSLQSLLTNRLFIAGKRDVTPDDYASFACRADTFFTVLSRRDSYGIIYEFTADHSHRILKTVIDNNDKTVNINWDYAAFETFGNRLFPMKMNMALTVPDNLISMSLSFSSMDIDAAFELKTDIPPKYKPIDIDRVIQLIQSF
jgi:hypothetical protein